GKVGDKEVSVINIMVGVLSFIIAVYLIFREPDNSAAISAGAFTLLFSFTYLWVGANQFLKADGIGLGWFCFFVSITAAPSICWSELHRRYGTQLRAVEYTQLVCMVCFVVQFFLSASVSEKNTAFSRDLHTLLRGFYGLDSWRYDTVRHRQCIADRY
ncbi:AmiS/UreI family transporter, partial [Vreelandella alkaliphila]|uniref:AmiS/UreI family transporter n=2 Tax=Halomonadaceae TaxID=28256 RepID=UPI003FD79EC9